METKDKDPAHTSLLKANQDHFDEQATKWDDDPEYVRVSRESYATILHHMGQFLLSSSDRHHHHSNILNFGCGTGLLEAQLRSHVNSITGIDISAGMIERMNTKIEQEGWTNVTALKIDILDEAQTSSSQQQQVLLPIEGFDMIISCYTFHHLHDVTAIGKALLKYLKPGGYFCIIDFAAAAETNDVQQHHHHDHRHQEQDQQQEETLGDKLSETAKASIGSHDGFSKSFLIDYYQNVLDLENVNVEDATPLSCDGSEFPTLIAYGRRKK
jgi:2-polyprenyl-3-methyl-5-hydroxy-6-metoxy-1,4-benzoquinol methylase